ncbi:hypothetical protein [Treponema socranskii]|nr:hypothetical protein [Treponema socranskii]MDR9858266.1 hypothetical protein [Treponema socranskii]
MLDYILIGCAALIIIFALRYFIKLTERDKRKTAGTRQKMYSFANCPLCASPLYKEDLYSRVFRPMTVSDQRCIILGCPHCYPKPEPGVKRVCPVCHKEVPPEGHLVARLFNKTKDGKKHVIVTGCSVCCKYEPS